MRKPTVNKSVLIAGAAAVVLIGSAGVFLALNPSPPRETQSQPGQEADGHDDHGDEAEGVEREGEPKTPATRIAREVAKILKQQRERVVDEVKKIVGFWR